MELTIEEALQQGITAHKEGKIQDAERLYRAILHSKPEHPVANHNLGVLAVSVNKTNLALPLFKIALEAYPKKEQFWLSYIDALIEEQQNEKASQVIEQAKKQIVAKDKLNILETKLALINNQKILPNCSPCSEQLNNLSRFYQNASLDEAEKLAISITKEFPHHPFSWKILGGILAQTGRFSEAVIANQTAVDLYPQDAETHNNLGVSLTALGQLEEAEASCKQAIALNPDFAEAHNNLGSLFKDQGRLTESEASYNQAISLNPNYVDAYWNLHGLQKTLKSAISFIDKCLELDKKNVEAKLMKAALTFYQGDKSDFKILMQSDLNKHPYMRSFAWVFSLPILPELYFNRWHFFEAIVKKSITVRPFYEFGVWRATSFKYLIKFFKKGYGFDTFSGLPIDWDVGSHIEKKGSYSSDTKIPKIKGGEFIVGEFKETLPNFFSKNRPIASVINFDADLYSSTICALNFAKKVIDKDTILIFDELIIHESWEKDEFRALNEFCSINDCSYEVIAVSFFTKQVAIKLIGI